MSVQWEGRHSRYKMIEPRLLKHEMHMTGPPTVPAQFLQQLSHRSVIWNRIRHGHNGVEPEHTLLVTVYYGAAVGLGAPVVVLHVILAVAVRLPDIDFHASHRVASGRLDSAQDEQRVPIRVGRDGEAVGIGRSIVGMEGAKDCAFCGV